MSDRDDDFSCQLALEVDDQYNLEKQRYDALLFFCFSVTLINVVFILTTKIAGIEDRLSANSLVTPSFFKGWPASNPNTKEPIPPSVRRAQIALNVSFRLAFLWYLATGILQAVLTSLMIFILVPTCPVLCLNRECEDISPTNVLPISFLVLSLVWLKQAYNVWSRFFSFRANASSALKEALNADDNDTETHSVDVERGAVVCKEERVDEDHNSLVPSGGPDSQPESRNSSASV